MDDLDSLLKQLGQASGGPDGSPKESTESELDALLSNLKSPITSSISSTPTASSFSGPLPITTLPQPSRVIPESIKEYRPPTIDLLPTKPIPTIFGFTGPLRLVNTFKPVKNSKSEKFIISKKPKIVEHECDPGLIIHPDIGHKLEYPQHKFNEFITTVVFDPNTHNSLQKCIDSIPPYSILQVSEGTYEESLKFKRPIFIQGIGDVKVKCNDGINISCQESVIENITFDGESCRGNSVTIINGVSRFSKCKIKGSKQVAIQVEGKAHVELTDCIISKGQNIGIRIQDTATAVLVDTTVKKSEGFGVECLNYAKLSMDNCTITANQKYGLGIYDRTNASISGCKITKNKLRGIELQSRGNDIYFENNTIDNNGTVGVYISQRARVTFVNNTFSNHQMTGIEAKEGSRLIMHGNKFLNANDNPLLNLTDKSRAYSDHDTFSGQCRAAVGVTNGAYFLGRYGKFEHLKICGILTYDSGRVNLQMCDFAHNNGPSVQSRSTLFMRNCTFSDSPDCFLVISSGTSGRAVNCSFVKATQCLEFKDAKNYIFDNCIFSETNTVGIKLNGSASPKFVDCKFYKHSNYGCRISGEGRPTFEFCEFVSCRCGCFVLQGCQPSFVGCTFSLNNEFGFISEDSRPTLTNCLISENEDIGFSATKGTKMLIKNCHITENKRNGGQVGEKETRVDIDGCVVSKQGGKGLLIQTAECYIKNSQFHENDSHHIFGSNMATIEIEDCEFAKSTCGKGVVFKSAETVTIKRSDLHHEETAIFGQGKFKLNVENSTIHNSKKGILLCENCEYYIFECEVKENDNAGVYVDDANGEIKNCNISNNLQSGIDTNCEVKLTNNRMIGNMNDTHRRK